MLTLICAKWQSVIKMFRLLCYLVQKWRRRYFVLYAPPKVEDFPTDVVSAMLEYYSDKKLHNKCGSIDLTTCEEVYSELDSETYKHVFCIKVLSYP